MSIITEELLSISPNSTNSTDDGQLPSHIVTLMNVDQYLNYAAVIIIMIGMGGATDIAGIKKSLRRPWGIIVCCLTQFVILPAIAYGLAIALDMEPTYAVGLIVQCTAPGGSVSNMLAYFAKGNISLSVCLTTFSTLLAVGTMPLNLFVYGRKWTDAAQIAIPYLNVVISLILTLVPTAFGLLLKYKLPKYIDRITQVCSVVGTSLILIGIALRAYIQPGIFLNSWQIWVLVSCLPIIGGLIGFAASSIICQPCSNRRTIGIETGCQNVALALNVINTSFPPSPQRAVMQVISSLYGPVMAAELSLIVGVYRAFSRYGHCRRCDDAETVKDDVEEVKVGDINAELKMEDVTCKTSETQTVDVGPSDSDGNIYGDEKAYTNYSFES
ncbi:ileal sodium/bile acid cotransporter-like [Ptychodera flava]|uniref:ileal sodium/bile acid cotransporter-like n=1 Tax=Ptychodera flava TaxID=63121 RepID=UPI003969F537